MILAPCPCHAAAICTNVAGLGTSPALHGDAIVVNWDHEGESFIVALDKRTGAERWRGALAIVKSLEE